MNKKSFSVKKDFLLFHSPLKVDIIQKRFHQESLAKKNWKDGTKGISLLFLAANLPLDNILVPSMLRWTSRLKYTLIPPLLLLLLIIEHTFVFNV